MLDRIVHVAGPLPLSIVDAHGGRQPLVDHTGPHLAGNGEFHDHAALRSSFADGTSSIGSTESTRDSLDEHDTERAGSGLICLNDSPGTNPVLGCETGRGT